MTENDRQECLAMLLVLAETFGIKPSEPRLEAYWQALKDLDMAKFRSAARAHLQNGKRFPTPADLRELATGTTEDRAASAWAALWDAAKRIDAYDSLAVGDGALAFALEATFRSWPDFCASDYSPEMWAAKRKEFTAAYRAGLGRQSSPRLFDGRHAMSSAQTGHAGTYLTAAITNTHDVVREIPNDLNRMLVESGNVLLSQSDFSRT